MAGPHKSGYGMNHVSRASGDNSRSGSRCHVVKIVAACSVWRSWPRECWCRRSTLHSKHLFVLQFAVPEAVASVAIGHRGF